MRHLTRFALLVALLAAAPVAAQTTNTLAWDYDAPPAEVATYTQTVVVDGTTVAGLPSCIARQGNPQHTTCQIAIPALAPGAHTISVTAARAGQTAEPRLTGLDPLDGPRSPQGPRVTVTVTITVP